MDEVAMVDQEPHSPRRRWVPWVVALVVLAVTGAGLGWAERGTRRADPSPSPSPTSAASGSASVPALPTVSGPPVGTLVVAAGDITCPPDMEVGGECRQADTARLAERLDPAAVLALGDLVYPGGDPEGFAKAYAPTWGRLRDRTYPAVGNHEYLSAGAEPYFRYWGARAGPGWYSVDVAGWHLVALNANCAKVGCGADSPQGKWLEADLARSHARCTLAFWHEPRWSSGLHGPDVGTDPLWRAVHAAGVDVVLSGHDHHYERFAPLSADGKPVAPGVGTRQFVVGTGGRSLYPIVRDLAGSEQRVATAYGLLALRLQPNAYSWQFVATDGRILDAGGPTPCR